MSFFPRSVGTHDGTFHADEVTACALLCLFGLVDKDKIHRTRDSALLNQCEYVCDVGGIYAPDKKLFDHHQLEYEGTLSSAGMILLYLKEKGILNEQDYHFYNNALVMGVDAHDNGTGLIMQGVCTYSQLISNFTPIQHEVSSEVQNEAFMEAFQFAFNHLDRLRKRHEYVLSCKEIVRKAMQDRKEWLFFEHSIPWMESFFELEGATHPARFVIMPSGKHWKLRGIPPTLRQSMQVRTMLPIEWAGLLNSELKEVTNIPGAIFCHKGRFISVWETNEDAFKALKFILNKEGA
jgi:uncharacterized UPF0160 family protein